MHQSLITDVYLPRLLPCASNFWGPQIAVDLLRKTPRKRTSERSHRIETYRDIILTAIEAQVDVTLVELADMLRREHGACFAPSTVSRFS